MAAAAAADGGGSASGEGENSPSPPSLFGPSQRALSVLDGMAVCEVAWHDGGSLPETLYACLYLHPAVVAAVLGGLGWTPAGAGAAGAAGGAKSVALSRLDLRIKEGE